MINHKKCIPFNSPGECILFLRFIEIEIFAGVEIKTNQLTKQTT